MARRPREYTIKVTHRYVHDPEAVERGLEAWAMFLARHLHELVAQQQQESETDAATSPAAEAEVEAEAAAEPAGPETLPMEVQADGTEIQADQVTPAARPAPRSRLRTRKTG